MSLASLQNVDFDSVEDGQQDGFAPIPDGEYQLEVVEAYDEVTNGGYGQLKLQCAIIGPTHANRRVFTKFFTSHHDKDKQKAVNIGKAQLKNLCTINGLNRWPKSEKEVVGWKFNAKIDYREYDGRYFDDVKYIKKFGKPTGEYGTSQLYIAALAAYKSESPVTASFNDDDIPF